jgi:hypothetical protein
MRVKFLIVLPMILSLGILIGHMMQVLASPGTPNPGHSVAQIGSGTFAEQGDYIFPGTSRIGIGTSSPTSKLHLYDAATNNYLTITAPFAAQSSISFGDITNGQDIVTYRPQNTRDYRIYTATAGDVLSVTQAGNVGIGNAAPPAKLSVMSDGTNTGGIAVQKSDVALILSNVGGTSNAGKIQVKAGGLIGGTSYTLAIQPEGGLTSFGGTIDLMAMRLYYYDWNSVGAGNDVAKIVNDNVGYKALMIVGSDQSQGYGRWVRLWDYLTVEGSQKITGNLNVGGTVSIGYAMYDNTCLSGSIECTVSCPAGRKAVGGGCETDQDNRYLVRSVPLAGGAGWKCRYHTSALNWIVAIVYCARIQ